MRGRKTTPSVRCSYSRPSRSRICSHRDPDLKLHCLCLAELDRSCRLGLKNVLRMQRIFRTRRRVEFSDTDMAGIAHFSNFFRYMEQAEHEFLRHVGKNVVLYDDRGTLGFPKLEAHCEYKHPAVHDAEMTIELLINCDDGKTIQYNCSIYQEVPGLLPGGDQLGPNGTRTDRRLLAEGYLRVACCRFPTGELPYPIPIPEDVLSAIESVSTEQPTTRKR